MACCVGITFKRKNLLLYLTSNGGHTPVTKYSDFLSYSGHSALGGNIKALTTLGEVVPHQYTLFMVNGCDTFSYVDPALAGKYQALNPNYSKDKFVDIITNAMPSYFIENKRSNMAVINALLEKKKTYKEILAEFDPYQKAVVTGEQDNRWPLEFWH